MMRLQLRPDQRANFPDFEDLGDGYLQDLFDLLNYDANLRPKRKR